ncbi:MAG: aspartate kinase [Anaerophaga sp.]|uniref:aspartate kinase n=1 Tax=Anaerophaga thermohalophila TaxID=177400 RepID=UPI000237CE0C|nr:aspartate kinase [Anaerophaga thermohalophila]MDK2841073.1 aspartate kinase [Anaerophaga sp.]MDN5291599.1 aspartate kinase [Anaerophaga sp.]
MQISKFGGASVKDADSVCNLLKIVEQLDRPHVVVVSAMGKTTNALEALAESYFSEKPDEMKERFQLVKSYHEEIAGNLFGRLDVPDLIPFYDCLQSLECRLDQMPSMHFDYEYDQIVSYGELLSTLIISAYLNHSGVQNTWVDIRQVLKTDDIYRAANVNWDLTSRLMHETFAFEGPGLYLTQGFLGGTISNISTTLGREGSDYTAAIIGNVMDAGKVTVWKDVPGILNADPRIFTDAQKIDALSYAETIELSYYGAQVIHPKTLKPLQNKKIPLFVKSFLNPLEQGTIISGENPSHLPPIYILKRNQVFLTLSPRDYSFITENYLGRILSLFGQYRVGINLLQTSALNFTACVDNREELKSLLENFMETMVVRYNENVDLLTIRHYTQDVIEEKLNGYTVIDSQITRKNARFVISEAS